MRARFDDKPGDRIVKWPKAGGDPVTLAQLKVGVLNQGPGHRRATIDDTHNYYLDD